MKTYMQTIIELLESIGLPAPQIGEPIEAAWGKIIFALEKLIAVTRAAKEFIDVPTLEPWDVDAEIAYQSIVMSLQTTTRDQPA